MHLVTIDLDCALIWGFLFLQKGKIRSGMFADVDKPSSTLCHKTAHTFEYFAPLKPLVGWPPFGPKEIDGLLVLPGKAYMLLTTL